MNSPSPRRTKTAPGCTLICIGWKATRSNAGGWYRRAGKEYSTALLATEWDDIAIQLLKKESP